MAKFWFDQRGADGANGEPAAVIDGLNGQRDGNARKSIFDLYHQMYAHLKIPDKYAIFMIGTTRELEAEMMAAYSQKMQDIGVVSGQLAAWYIRRSFEGKFETIVCIAGRGRGDGHYWNLRDGDPPASLGASAGKWKELPEHRPPGSDRRVLPLISLRDALRAVGGVQAWYGSIGNLPGKLPAEPPDLADWRKVFDQLLALDQENTDKDKRVCSDKSHTRLYVEGDEPLGTANVPDKKESYVEAIRIIKVVIDRQSVNGTSDKVFRAIGIKNDEHGLRLKQISDLKYEVDKSIFSYRNLKNKSTNSAFICTMSGSFITMRTHKIYKQAGLPLDKTYTYTGGKVHFSIDENEVEKAWDLVLPLLLGDSEAIPEFKVTDLEYVRPKRADNRARRIIEGAQITVYLHAAPGEEKRAARRFAIVMTAVSRALSTKFRPGVQPPSDLPITPFLSFRRDFNDLLDPGRAAKNRKEAIKRKQQVEEYVASEPADKSDATCIADDYPNYEIHKERMKKQALYVELKKLQV